MPLWPASQQAEFVPPQGVGPGFLCFPTIPAANALPAVIADGITWSQLFFSDGFPKVGVGITSDHAATLTLQRYADVAGTVKVGALVSVAIVGATPNWASLPIDGMPFASVKISIINSAGAVANLTNTSILFGS